TTLDCYNVSPEVSTPRRQRHFVEASFRVGSGNNLLPFAPAELVNDVGVAHHKLDNCVPWNGHCRDDLTFCSAFAGNHDCLKQDGGARRKKWSDASRSPAYMCGLHSDHVSFLMLYGNSGVCSAH